MSDEIPDVVTPVAVETPIARSGTHTAKVLTGRSSCGVFQMGLFFFFLLLILAFNITGFTFCIRSDGCELKNLTKFEERYGDPGPAELFPIIFPMLFGLLWALTVWCCCLKWDRGCCMSNRATMYRDAYTYLFFSFYGIELMYFLGNILIFVFVSSQLPLFMFALGQASLVATLITHIYKFRIRHDDSYKGKMKRVSTTLFLLGIEDAIFLQIKVTAILQSDEAFIIVSICSTAFVMLLRITGFFRHCCCGSPVYNRDTYGAVANNVIVLQGDPDSGTTRILTDIPMEHLMDDALEGIKIKIRKEGYFSFFLFGVVPAVLGVVLLGLFVAALVLDRSSPGLRPDSVFEDDGFFFGIVGSSISLFFLSIMLYLCCHKMDRGCCLRDQNLFVAARKRKMVFSTRSLEIADFLSDVGSVVIIFKDYPEKWQILMVVSLVSSAVLNLAYFRWVQKDVSYQGKKKEIALSLCLLSAEDFIMVPINIGYFIFVTEAVEAVEYWAVGIASLVGLILLFVRIGRTVTHLLFGAPVYTGDALEDIEASTARRARNVSSTAEISRISSPRTSNHRTSNHRGRFESDNPRYSNGSQQNDSHNSHPLNHRGRFESDNARYSNGSQQADHHSSVASRHSSARSADDRDSAPVEDVLARAI
uniref:Uncharacterized protein n=1 Tax=Aplanochytrium stocchinoi TaxID=215587 RepID=A0A7S3PAK3_9STRA|mmetsp:Transcript_6252/g.8211  ORF Transcript_6252/g.8211 Transcript_6252/m.8211 type:complete len:647 (-) Transcript_6252:289-2229(-)